MMMIVNTDCYFHGTTQPKIVQYKNLGPIWIHRPSQSFGLANLLRRGAAFGGRGGGGGGGGCDDRIRMTSMATTATFVDIFDLQSLCKD